MDKKQYVCAKCGHTNFESYQFQATGGNLAKMFDVQNFINNEGSSGCNILDFLINN